MSRPVPAALLPWLDALLCPHCREPFALTDRTLRCPSGHSFDLARAWYVSLLPGSAPISGDDGDMARARDSFLSTGAYDALRGLTADLAARALEGTDDPRVLDIGCGTGHYLSSVLDRVPGAQGLGVDTAPRALRFAARAHDRAAAAGWDVFSPFPLRDAGVDLVMDVFAPRNPAEFARVLRPGGRLLVVRPAAEHLAELREHVPGMVRPDPRKEERLAEALAPHFAVEDSRPLRFTVALDDAMARDLVAMTPSARHVDLAALDGLDGPGGAPREVTVSVLASLHRPR